MRRFRRGSPVCCCRCRSKDLARHSGDGAVQICRSCLSLQLIRGNWVYAEETFNDLFTVLVREEGYCSCTQCRSSLSNLFRELEESLKDPRISLEENYFVEWS